MPPAMHWIALRWLVDNVPAEQRQACIWWALRFTPRVAVAGPVLLLEVSGCMRLWGGRRALLQHLLRSAPDAKRLRHAEGASSLVALARLRLLVQGHERVQVATLAAADLPWSVLDAAQSHGAILQRLGLRTWGELDALPRSALARRFGAGLLHALDVAFGRAADSHRWQELPERFARTLQLPQRADTAPALLWTARRLLGLLTQWLLARQQGVLALQLAWQFDQRRANGQELPCWQMMEVRTAQPVQAMAHLERLLAERLARVQLLAPASSLRLRVLEAAPWQPPTPSLLLEDTPEGEPWHRFIERVQARLGADCALMPVLDELHGSEARQRWVAAEAALPRSMKAPASTTAADAMAPAWLLHSSQPLGLHDGKPCLGGQPLHLLTSPNRIETGWWDGLQPRAGREAAAFAARDYFVAQCPGGPLLWVYRERRTTGRQGDALASRWFVQGIYA